MRIENNQNVSFRGLASFNRQADSQNPLIKPLVNYLKHHCGSKELKHKIRISDIQFSVSSIYRPTKKIDGYDQYAKVVDIVSPDSKATVTKEKVDYMITNMKETTEWFKALRKVEKSNAKKEI